MILPHVRIQVFSFPFAAKHVRLGLLTIYIPMFIAALGYGITKTDLPEDKPRNVMFVDIGHSNCSVAVVAFKKGELTVKSTVWDKDFGGRNFDQLLLDHFANEFKVCPTCLIYEHVCFIQRLTKKPCIGQIQN
jgi:heat shock 70kDa protein 4